MKLLTKDEKIKRLLALLERAHNMILAAYQGNMSPEPTVNAAILIDDIKKEFGLNPKRKRVN